MPGAGTSTLLAGRPARPDIVLDSDTRRAALQAVFGCYRPVVHAWHRLALVVAAAFSAAQTVVVHLPATSAGARAAVARLARLTGRAAHLLWLHVDPADARACQQARGRVVGEASFAGHAERALTTVTRRDAPPPGFADVTVLDRAAAAGGLELAEGQFVGR